MKRSDKRYFLKDFSKGCKKCARGAKMVLLVTGRCHRRCYYCPLSSEKYGKDVVYANEGPVSTDGEILLEARSMRALGTGITGGEPLLVPERTMGFIKLLKKEFGPSHHIHLYTAGEADPVLVNKLSKAGLDEIRFHPPEEDWMADSPRFLPAFDKAVRTGMDVGIEIPCIPGKHREITELARRFFDQGLGFLNLNELEASETNWAALRERGFDLLGDTNAIKGSRTTGLKVLRALEGRGRRVNLCTSGYKDAVQLRRRLLRRARTVGKPYHIITEDATFYFGVVDNGGTDPADFVTILKQILKEYGVPPSLYRFTSDHLETASWVLEELHRDIPFPCSLVEAYPSIDGLEVERTPLDR